MEIPEEIKGLIEAEERREMLRALEVQEVIAGRIPPEIPSLTQRLRPLLEVIGGVLLGCLMGAAAILVTLLALRMFR